MTSTISRHLIKIQISDFSEDVFVLRRPSGWRVYIREEENHLDSKNQEEPPAGGSAWWSGRHVRITNTNITLLCLCKYGHGPAGKQNAAVRGLLVPRSSRCGQISSSLK